MSACEQPGLMSVETALGILLKRVPSPPQMETIALSQALGRVLAEDVVSSVDVPPADNSAMDGYCARLTDIQPGKVLPVSQRIPAGAVATPLQPGTAARIFTGAELPENADVVIMQENAEQTGDGILIHESPSLRQHIRPQGQDIQTGSVILTQGSRIRPQDMGLLASVGVNEIKAYRPLKVAIFSTGDEIVEPGQHLEKGQIYNSNRFTLIGMIQHFGWEVLDLGIIADDLEATKIALQQATQADLIVTSGGVSVGEEDHVKHALDALGEVQLWKLAIKPGKPFTFGHVQGTPFMGLPGNPAAVLMTFSILCRPWLLKAQGAANLDVLTVQAKARFSIRKPAVRQQYMQAQLTLDESGQQASLYPNQSSGVLSSASWANAVVVVPPNTVVAEGDSVNVIPFNSIFN